METIAPNLNPTTNRPTGKATRYVRDSRSHRNIRLDQVSDARLMTACRLLAGDSAKDCISCSALVRRAVMVYSSHLERLRQTTDPGLWSEKAAVRERTKLPNGPRKKSTLWDKPAQETA